ncbi:class I SAM-dependent methyltransferase family protein, partial [Candidatus Woesearchaeota archaeon]|nr:class I SAM-dependent methyltransferase family protein [Candidatus Woesearchaeota archaeon]
AEAILGDAREIVPQLGKFDRIVMPLPKTADQFLDVALSASKPDSIIHFYDFASEAEFPNSTIDKIKKACTAKGRNCKMIANVKCGNFAPGIYRVCVDFKVL